MRISITDTFTRDRIPEGTRAVFTANFFDDSDSWVATAPTSAKYRIDNPQTGCQITGWTSLTPASSISITLSGSSQSLVDQCALEEPRRLTVRGDDGLTTQTQATRDWTVVNAYGTP